jgi:integrase
VRHAAQNELPVFDPAAEKAGLPGLTPHELRHTGGEPRHSRWRQREGGAHMLGHASAAMTF